jgi:heme-degrading monooxygenase HmoA
VFFSIHHMTGDPNELLEQKRQSMDPVVERLAPGFGAILSVTVRTDDGITTYNLWDSADGAAAFTQHPEAIEAQKESGLPMPSAFERYDDPHVTFYQRTEPL